MGNIVAEEVINELLKSACQSIQYRVRQEILGESITTNEMKILQTQILQNESVKGIINSQESDGWLGQRFHGYESLEAGIRFLCEKGICPQNPALARALQLLETKPDRMNREMGKVGLIFDELGFGGTNMIRATIFAYAGIENKSFVKDQINVALEGFRAVLKVESIDRIVELFKGKLVFKPGVKWPSIYHLRLLALTQSWRVPKNQKMIVESVNRLVKLSPLPYINVRYKSQLTAPASFGMQDFNPAMISLDLAGWMMWFQRMELLSRLEVTHAIPELQDQVDSLNDILEQGGGRFTRPIKHEYFKKWGAYTGLMLEQDWRSPQRRISDLTFRSLLINHYSEI